MACHAEMLLSTFEVLSRLMVISANGRSPSHACIGKDLSIEDRMVMKWFLNDLMALSALLAL